MKKSECEMCGYKERRVVDGKIPLLLNFEDGDIRNRNIENLKSTNISMLQKIFVTKYFA